MQDRIERAEEQIAYLTKTVEELSDVVVEQGRRIERLERQLGLLMEREAEREYEGGGTIPLSDQKPPHW
ncbi:MAG: SlyX family protein [Thioclava marina]|jgi:SlyX.|uniref:SlyX protein n=1 Tax=Thioclava marina TaxID=1915077 RepID=A0ABX3MJP8_9RHOB|nr:MULTISPECIES: SlyX family protein [Thioclava]MBC7144711.1 SlyX family protein [Thioclava marina]MBD3804284.1 SlyX family protein [Thioclava sp.]OOY11582.1 SlyX protein [Thioclava marina]TNF10409.1 MAG: SlyX family protein [Paracoccaceae bacterium]